MFKLGIKKRGPQILLIGKKITKGQRNKIEVTGRKAKMTNYENNSTYDVEHE